MKGEQHKGMKDRILIQLSGYAMALMMVLIVIQVIARYVFVSPLSWSEELTRAVFVWFTMVGVYLAFRQGRHIGIEAFPRLMGNLGKKIVRIIENIVVLAFIVIMTWYGMSYAMSMSQNTPALRIPMWLIYGIIPLTGLALVIDSIRQILHISTSERKAEQI